MIIREFLPSDVDAVFEVEQRCFSEEKRSLNLLLSSVNSSNFIGFILVENGAIGGFITANYCLDESDILTVAVEEKHRRKGYGVALLNALKDGLKSLGVNKIFLEVKSTNTPAISLYTKFGFAKISVRKNYYGNNLDALIYCLEI